MSCLDATADLLAVARTRCASRGPGLGWRGR